MSKFEEIIVVVNSPMSSRLKWLGWCITYIGLGWLISIVSVLR